MFIVIFFQTHTNTDKHPHTHTHAARHAHITQRTCIIASLESRSQRATASARRERGGSLCVFPPKVYHALTLPQSRPRPTPTAQLGAPKSGNVRRLALSRCSTVAEIATLLEFDFDFGFSQSQKTALYAFRPKTHNSRSRLALTNQQKIRKKSGKKFYIL